MTNALRYLGSYTWRGLPRRLETQSVGTRRKPLVSVSKGVRVLLGGREYGGVLQILDVGGDFPMGAAICMGRLIAQEGIRHRIAFLFGIRKIVEREILRRLHLGLDSARHDAMEGFPPVLEARLRAQRGRLRRRISGQLHVAVRRRVARIRNG